MWELDEHMQKNEELLYEGTPKWIGYIWYYIWALITLVTVIIPIFLIAYAILHKKSTKYALSSKRVIERSGILTEDLKTATFKFITSVRLRQSLFGKIFGYADLIIDTAGTGSDVDFTWRYVDTPLEVKNKLEELVDKNENMNVVQQKPAPSDNKKEEDEFPEPDKKK